MTRAHRLKVIGYRDQVKGRLVSSKARSDDMLGFQASSKVRLRSKARSEVALRSKARSKVTPSSKARSKVKLRSKTRSKVKLRSKSRSKVTLRSKFRSKVRLDFEARSKVTRLSEQVITVKVTVLVQENDRLERASLVTLTEKLLFLQSEVNKYLQAP